MADTGTKSIVFDFARSIPNGDKIAHFALYGILAFLLNLALEFRALILRGYKLQWGATIVLLFAVTEEISQYFFPNRSLSLTDALADIIGVSLFSYLSVTLKQKFIHITSKVS
jgi:VanZ family protein